MKPGEQISALMNGRVVPAVEELLRRWERLYPVLQNRRVGEVLACRRCGRYLASENLHDGDCQRLVLRGRHLGHPDDDSEDEYVMVCPNCGAPESFEEVAG